MRPASSPSMAAVASPRRDRRRRHPRRSSRGSNGIIFTAFAVVAWQKLDQPNFAVHCLLLPSRRAASIGRRLQPPSLPFLETYPYLHMRQHQHHTHAPTSLHLFDRFLHPYGVSNKTNDYNDDDLGESSIELLNALLPQLQTKEERSRLLEEFHRARLDHQLRLSKRSKGGTEGGGDGSADFLADNADEVKRMTDLFQQARLREQLRLSKRGDEDEHSGDSPSMSIDKDEAFHRALLEERLRIRRLRRQRQHFLSAPDSIENAMMEYENEREEEHKGLQTMTMVQEDEDGEDTDETGDNAGEEIENAENNAVVVVRSADENADNNGKAVTVVGELVPVNQTEDGAKLLSEKLERLHQMVTNATSSPVDTRPETKGDKPKSSLQSFLSGTHLPLPPREDASLLSLALAPLAHLFTSAFLLGVAGVYAALAILDVLWNDDKDEYNTRKCLKEASSVVPQCVDYVFPADGKTVQRSAFQRTFRALQTSCIASYYAIECIVLRAAKHSKWATECMDAGTGALRYLVYAARSLNVLWVRAVDSLVGSPRNKEQSKSLSWIQELNPFRAISKRFNKQRSLKDEQRRLSSIELYDNKLRQLNLDRVALERDRKVLEDERNQLEVERRQLLSEGVNVLAWYSAATEAAAAVKGDGKESQEVENRKKKGRWSWRRGNDDGQDSNEMI